MAILDQSLLKAMTQRYHYDKVYDYIPMDLMDKHTQLTLKSVRKYYDEHPDMTKIDFGAFTSLFFTKYNKKLKDDEQKFYTKLIANMKKPLDPELRKSMINNLLERRFATAIANVANDYEEGEEIDIVQKIGDLYKEMKLNTERTVGFEFAGFDEALVGETSEDSGYAWPFPTMNETYRNLQGGDQYIVAARPGQGKTSLLCYINKSVAPTMPENKVIVWFNNESKRARIMSRQVQAALGKSDEQLAQMTSEERLNEYIKVMGRKDKVQVYDIHGRDNRYLEEILEHIGYENVGMIIFDMLDKVRYKLPDGMREDQRLEALYTWSRELGVMCDAPSIPTSQVSVEGAGLEFPEEHMLKDSKTGKQGACDGIIMLGHSNDPDQTDTRWLSMPKTKSKRDGKPDMRMELAFNPTRGTFKEA